MGMHAPLMAVSTRKSAAIRILKQLLRGVAQEGATATVSVLDRRGKRLGTVYLGHMPEAGQGTLTAQLSALLRDILSRVDSQGLRLVYVTDEGYHPSDYYHRVLKKMTDPRRPWRRLEWRRIIDFYHACQYLQQLADAIVGTGTEAQSWAKQMRHVLKTTLNLSYFVAPKIWSRRGMFPLRCRAHRLQRRRPL